MGEAQDTVAPLIWIHPESGRAEIPKSGHFFLDICHSEAENAAATQATTVLNPKKLEGLLGPFPFSYQYIGIRLEAAIFF